MQTNTEYMSDPARAERVVRQFLDMTVLELKSTQTNTYINYITADIIRNEDLSEEMVQDMTWLELACLIRQAGGNPKYDWNDHDSLSEQLMYYRYIVNALMDGSKSSIPIRLFLALPLKAFYDCLHRLSGAPGLTEAYARIRDRSQCGKRQDCTIKEFLTEELGITNKIWLPMVPIEKFRENVWNAYENIGIVLIESFCTAFSQENSVADICAKYHDPEKDCPCDWPDDMEWAEEELPF